MKTFRINRRGCLAVHLMPRWHGETLKRHVDRIEREGPRDKFEREAVRLANLDDCGDDPKIKEVPDEPSDA